MINDEIEQQISAEKIFIFHEYFFNTDISLIIGFIIMKIGIHVAEDCLEGTLSQNVDIGLSFDFILCRSWNFGKN